MVQFRRAYAKPKPIAEINPEKDIRARIFGTVIEKREDSIILDDGTKNVEVFLDSANLEKIKEKDVLRIFGRVLPYPDGFEIQAEVVQNMNNLNFDLYKKIKEKFNVSL